MLFKKLKLNIGDIVRVKSCPSMGFLYLRNELCIVLQVNRYNLSSWYKCIVLDNKWKGIQPTFTSRDIEKVND